MEKGDQDGARAAWGKGRDLQRTLAREHPEIPIYACTLGITLANLGSMDLNSGRFAEARDQFREAITWQKRALAASPESAFYRSRLAEHYTGLAKVAQGREDRPLSREATQGLTELEATDPGRIALGPRLAAVLQGEPAKDIAERLALAPLAYEKERFVLAARLMSEVLEADPKLGDEFEAQHRGVAARCAAMAAGGRGKDDPTPDSDARARLRKRAPDWLGAELADLSKHLDSDPSVYRSPAKMLLLSWQEDEALASLREERELARLPEGEREAFRKFWADVASLLTRVKGGK